MLPTFLESVPCPLRGPQWIHTSHCFSWQVFPHFCTPASASPSEQSWLKIASFALCFVSTQREAAVGVKRNLRTGFQKKGRKASLHWNGCQLRNFLRNDKDSHCGSILGIASILNTASSVGEGSSWGLLRDWSWFWLQCCDGFIFRKLTLCAGNFYNCQRKAIDWAFSHQTFPFVKNKVTLSHYTAGPAVLSSCSPLGFADVHGW